MALRVTSAFEGGNGRLQYTSTDSAGDVVYFAAEHKKGGPQALWFYLRIQGTRGPKLRCVLTNPSQILGGGRTWEHNSPVYRVGNGAWQRIRQVEDRVNAHLVPEVVLTVDIPEGEDEVEIAACYPYLMQDLEATVSAHSGVWTQTDIGASFGGRPITRVYNNLGDPEQSRPGAFFIARQHSGETPGSWVLDGILRFLGTPEGEAIAREMCIWAVPIADPDGVAEGAYGKDQSPWDLNRAWDRPVRPEIHAIQADLVRWTRRCRPHMIVDLHAPGYAERGFYFWAPTRPTSVAKVTHDVAYGLRERVPEHLRGTEPAYRQWGTVRTSVQQGTSCVGYGVEVLGIPTATLEISYHGPDEENRYSQEDYRMLGEALIKTIYETIPR